MGSDVSPTYLRGLGILDERCCYENVTARGVAGTSSDYDEASPYAGTPEPGQESAMSLEARGTPSQSANVKVLLQRAGVPGLEEAGFVWKSEKDATDYFGCDTPNLVTGWETLIWEDNSAIEHDPIPHVIRLQSGNLLAFAGQSKIGTQPVRIYRYTVSTGTWALADNLTLDDEASLEAASLVELPDETVLLFVHSTTLDQVDVYQSDDEGTSWSIYARRVLDDPLSTADIRELRACYSAGEVLLMACYRDGSSNRTMSQYASDDLGCSFKRVVDDWRTDATEDPESVNVAAANSGGFIIGYADNDGSTAPYRTRSLGSAFDVGTGAPLSTGLSPGLTGGAFASMALWRDEVGTLYIASNIAANAQIALVSRSLDDGDSWEAYGSRGLQLAEGTNVNDRFDRWSIAETQGRTAMLTRWIATTANEDPMSLGCVWLGGHSTHTAPAQDGATLYRDSDQIAFNERLSDNKEGGIWLPIEQPNLIGLGAWTATGGGAVTLASPGVLELTTTASAKSYSRTFAGASGEQEFGEFAVEIDDGDGSINSDVINVYLICGDGTNRVRCRIRLSSVGFRVYDEVAASNVTSTQTVDFTTKKHVRFALDVSGKMIVWWAAAAHNREWTEVSVTDLTPEVNAGNCEYHFGNGTGTAVSRWSLFGYCNWPGQWGAAADSLADDWSSPDDLHVRSMPASWARVYDDISIRATSGPGIIGDYWNVKQDSEYALANVFPEIDPTPGRGYRSVDETEKIITIDINGFTEARLRGTSLVVALLRVNFDQAILEGSADGVAWTTVGSLRANDGLTSLQFTRVGEVITPLKGGAAHKAERYLVANDLKDGTVKLDGQQVRRIDSNTSGAWTDETSAVPFVWLRDCNDGEGDYGACEMWARDICAVIHEKALTYRYLRIRIPAQTTANGYFEVGTLFLGYVDFFGRQYGRGWSVTESATVDVGEMPNGVTRPVKRGERVRQVEIGWPDGVDATDIQGADPVPDYITGTTAGVPQASPADVIRNIAGLIDQGDGAVRPVLYLGSVKRDAGVQLMNSPERFLYGRVTSEAGRTNVTGDENVSELERGDRIIIREIPG